MGSYLITGVSRGLGFEFLRQISSDPANVVVGLVRNKAETEAKIKDAFNRTNIYIVEGDLTDYDSLKKAADETAKITHGRLDYLIANAGLIPSWSAYDSLGNLGHDPSKLEQELLDCFKVNVIGNIHLFNVFMPLILKGDKKKVVCLSTGFTDLDLTRKYDIEPAGPYTISKAAMNAAVARYSAQYARDGVLFISIAPGAVETGLNKDATEEDIKKLMIMFGKFQEYAPHFTGPETPEVAIKNVISVFEKASLENGDGGALVSQFGNQQWL